MDADLAAVARGQVEVRMPGDGDGLVFAAHVFGNDAGVDGFGGERDSDDEVSLGEPVAAEVSGVDYAGDLFAAGNLFDLNVVGFCLEDEAVHGVALGGGQLADVVGGESNGVAVPLCGEGFAVCRELAANPVGVRNEEGRAEPVTEVAMGVIVDVEHLFCAGEIGRGDDVDVALAGEVGGDLDDFHAAAGGERDAGELGCGGAFGGAGERDYLLATDLDCVLRVACGCHHDRPGKTDQRECAKCVFHVRPSLRVNGYVAGIRAHRSLCRRESVFFGAAILPEAGGAGANAMCCWMEWAG